MKNFKEFSVDELETLRGGFADSEMVVSEEVITNEGDGALFNCCNNKKKDKDKVKEIEAQ